MDKKRELKIINARLNKLFMLEFEINDRCEFVHKRDMKRTKEIAGLLKLKKELKFQ